MKYSTHRVADKKRIKRLMWRSVAQGHVSKETVRKVYSQRPLWKGKHIRAVIRETFPARRPAYICVASSFVCSILLLYICGLNVNIAQLSKENQDLISSNNALSSNVESMNESLEQSKDKEQEQQEIINMQQGSMDKMEAEHQDELKKQEETIQELLDMIENMDIFDSVLSRSISVSSSTTQIRQAKVIILDTLGDSDLAAPLLAKLDEEQEKIDNYAKRYPDFNPTTGRLSSPYGYRKDPFTGKTAWHSGIDICNSTGTAIRSAAYGTVTYTGYGGGYGYNIIVDHGNGYTTRYAHLSKILVSKGDVVEKGEKIGLMGATGRATGPHLHFEVLYNGKTENPCDYVSY